MDRRHFLRSAALAGVAVAADAQSVPHDRRGSTLDGEVHGGPPVYVVQGASVFDSRSGAMLQDRTVVIEGERIRSVETPGHPLPIPKGAQVMDAHGKFVLPGLITSHAHLTHLTDAAHLDGTEMLPLLLANGITTFRDVGDDMVAESLIARYAEAHPERSPRIFMASRLLDGSPPIHRDICWSITDPSKVAAFAQDVAAWGAITLKIYAGTERPVGQRAIEEAHRYGLVAAAHLGKYSAQDAVADGIDSLEHIISIFNYAFPPDVPRDVAREQGSGSPEVLESRGSLDLQNPVARQLIASIIKNHVMVDPTLVVFRNMILLPAEKPDEDQYPGYEYVPDPLKRAWLQYLLDLKLDPPHAAPEHLRAAVFQKYMELTGILYRAGVPLLVGTDSPCPNVVPGFAMHEELQLLVASGIPPAAVLQAATLHGAKIIKQEAELGSIEPGKQADLVILDADPLMDIRNSRKIHRVIHRGHVVEPQKLLGSLRYGPDKGYPPYMPLVMN